MNPFVSLYMDLLRFSAAALVFFTHFSYARFTGDWFSVSPFVGHDAVIIFFVLSGYVIAYVTDGRENRFKTYAVSRLGRLYSVLLPALVLGAILDAIGFTVDPAVYSGWYAGESLWAKGVAHALYLPEIWTIHYRFGSNGPLWSIAYEFWYYVLFAIASFAPSRLRIPLWIATALFVGVKILLLLPIWYLGVLIYRLHGRISLGGRLAVFFYVGTMVVYLLIRQTEILTLVVDYSRHINKSIFNGRLVLSRNFLGDYLVGVLVALHMLSLPYLPFGTSLTAWLERMGGASVIRGLAGMTFSLYVFHIPLLCFLVTVLPYETGNLWHNLAMIATSWSVIFLLSRVTEEKKGVVRRWIYGMLGVVERWLPTRVPKA